MEQLNIFKFLLVAVVLTSAASQGNIVKITTSNRFDENIIELTSYDFDNTIVEYPTALVFFYAPWCSHCKRLKLEYAIAGDQLIRNDPPITLIKMDCTQAGKATCEKYSIGSYPTLLIFHYGEYDKKYDGKREAADIVKYMKAEAKPIIKKLNSQSDLENVLNTTKESVVIGFFQTDSTLNSVFIEAAKKVKMIKCQFILYQSAERAVLDQQNVSEGVVLFRPLHLKSKFEPSSVMYSGTANMSELNAFITTHFHGLVGIRKLNSPDIFTRPLIVVYFAIDYDNNAKRSSYWRNRVLVVAKEFQDKVTFAISSSDEFDTELNNVEIESVEMDKPVAVATNTAGKKSVLKEEFSVEALKTFTNNLLNGNLEIYIKSEPVPETQEGPVIVAVGKTFEDIVLNNGKDTFIEFYAPWCPHCQDLEPIYEELAETLQEEDIAIIKMDGTANEAPAPYTIDGYPTVYWAPLAQKDKPVLFEGDGSVENFISFIAQRATNELKGWDRNGKPRDYIKTEL